MRIIIPDTMCDDENFYKWLIKEIRQELILSCDENQLDVIGEYLEKRLGIKIDVLDAFFSILDSIVALKGNRIIQIVVPNKTIYKNTRLTTHTLAKLIDVGNIEVRGTHIFSMIFNKIRLNLDEYFTMYVFKNGGM